MDNGNEGLLYDAANEPRVLISLPETLFTNTGKGRLEMGISTVY